MVMVVVPTLQQHATEALDLNCATPDRVISQQVRSIVRNQFRRNMRYIRCLRQTQSTGRDGGREGTGICNGVSNGPRGMEWRGSPCHDLRRHAARCRDESFGPEAPRQKHTHLIVSANRFQLAPTLLPRILPRSHVFLNGPRESHAPPTLPLTPFLTPFHPLDMDDTIRPISLNSIRGSQGAEPPRPSPRDDVARLPRHFGIKVSLFPCFPSFFNGQTTTLTTHSTHVMPDA